MGRSFEVALLIIIALVGTGCRSTAERPVSSTNTSSAMINVTIPVLIDDRLPAAYTCDGQGINPPIEISDIPADAVSLVLHVVDYDVPKELKDDGTYHHWIVWNIDPRTTTIAEDSRPPSAIEGVNSSGRTGYVGPCPPDREHRYTFRIIALDTTLDLPSSSTAAEVLQAIGPHEIERGEAIGRYERS